VARAGWVVIAGLAFAFVGAPARGFEWMDVAERARSLAAEPYRDPSGRVPDWLLGLSYDQYREIRFRPAWSPWRDTPSPFEVQLFHPGLFYDRVVALNEIDAKGEATPIAFSPDLFDYGQNTFASRVPQDLGFAGFRLHYTINRRDYRDEVIVFLGATYLRAVARGQRFGLSARGLAIDTALPSGEEFPWFREFWLVRPAARARSAVIYALLDSPSVTGAYRFEVVPGAKTVVTVAAQIFFRRAVASLGLAPLTSMFFAGENGGPERRDYRPEVHDSDGLLLSDASGWRWRPLANPERLQVSTFTMISPRGFGLIQRDREFDHYQDFETRAELRPSAWIVPLNPWPAGQLRLVEIPTPSEHNDNVVAQWIAERPDDSLEPLAFSYALHFTGESPGDAQRARIVATRVAAGRDDAVQYFIDFEGDALAKISSRRVLEGVVSIDPPSAAAILDQQVLKNPATRGWRLVFQVRVSEPARLTAVLREGPNVLTERWVEDVTPP